MTAKRIGKEIDELCAQHIIEVLDDAYGTANTNGLPDDLRKTLRVVQNISQTMYVEWKIGTLSS